MRQLPNDAELKQLLSSAPPMTERDLWLQRVSFTYGQMMDCAPSITREEVVEAAVRIYGKCPE